MRWLKIGAYTLNMFGFLCITVSLVHPLPQFKHSLTVVIYLLSVLILSPITLIFEKDVEDKRFFIFRQVIAFWNSPLFVGSLLLCLAILLEIGRRWNDGLDLQLGVATFAFAPSAFLAITTGINFCLLFGRSKMNTFTP